MSRYDAFVRQALAAITEAKGETAADMRRALVEGRCDQVPAALKPYAEKVARRAWEITDADVDALRARGYTEDQIFEATASAAMGAAVMRLNKAMAVLREGRA